MPDRVEWNIAEDDAGLLAAADVLANDGPGGTGASAGTRTNPRRRFGARFWLFYLLTLSLAAVFGFGMGRYAESRQALYDEIERALALEALAQRTEDATLLAETLDPEAHRAWRSRMTRELLAGDAPPTGWSILDLEVLDEDEVRVRVAPRGAEEVDGVTGEGAVDGHVGAGENPEDLTDSALAADERDAGHGAEAGEEQLRRYRFVNGRWLHAPIEDLRRH